MAQHLGLITRPNVGSLASQETDDPGPREKSRGFRALLRKESERLLLTGLPMQHKIESILVGDEEIEYRCFCGQIFTGSGPDARGYAKPPQELVDHLQNKKGA